MSKNILITGGAGFIGVNSAAAFDAKGHTVTVLDNLSRKGTDINLKFLEENHPNVKFVKADIRTDTDQLSSLMEEADVVLHLAAQVAVTTSVTDPKEDFDINALGTFNVLEAVRSSKKQPAVIFASTNKVYGGLDNLPVQEKDKRVWFQDDSLQGVTEHEMLDFHSPYGCSKGAADQYVRDYSRIYDLKTVVFRQSCIYGQHQLGVEDQGWVAWFLIAGIFGKPVTIYGNGKQVRDLLHVDDLVSAYDVAIEKMDTLSGSVFNLGGGAENTLSLLEFFDFVKSDLGTDMNPGFSEQRPGDQPIFVSDNSAFEKATGWKPAVKVHDGIKKLHQWLSDHKSILETLY